MNRKLRCSSTIPIHSVTTCMGLGCYTIRFMWLQLGSFYTYHIQVIRQITVLLSRCQTLWRGENLCNQCSKIPYIKTLIDDTKFKQYSALTASIPRKETTFNLIRPTDWGSKFLKKTVSATLHGITPLTADMTDVQQFYPHLSDTNTQSAWFRIHDNISVHYEHTSLNIRETLCF